MIEDLKKEFPEKTFHQICDEAVRLIHANNFLTYVSDKDNPNYKSNEFWSYAIESAVLGIGDCNSDAVLRYVLCRIAGVPAQLLRIVAGIAGKFGGHATLYYYNSITNSNCICPLSPQINQKSHSIPNHCFFSKQYLLSHQYHPGHISL